MIRVVHLGSRIRMLTFSHPGSRIQGSKRSPIPDPGSGFATLNFSLLILKIIPLPYLVLKDPTAAISTSVADLDPGYGAFFNPGNWYGKNEYPG